jgi:hypothetical protein
VVGAVAAFAVGALAVVGWQMLPTLTRMADKPDPTFASTAKRMGVAAKGPVLRICVTSGSVELTPVDQYALLQASDRASRMAQLMGPNVTMAPNHFSMAWGEIADCIYRQNGRTFCEPDNRALAVEAATSLVRTADQLLSPHGSDSKYTNARTALEGSTTIRRQLDQMRDAKERVLAGLRGRLQEGRLVAADFGHFPPADIKRLLQEVKPARNACADEGLAG